jgi:selenide,water dikinase
VLQKALKDLPGIVDPNVLVGFETADDAGVYLIDEETAIVQSTDFFTPIVDDPFVYGQIAATNALSDIYAMGARPRFALSIVGFPVDVLDEEILHQILSGGSEKMREAAVAVIGGHSVKDPELKFGYVATGLAHPDRIYRNHGLLPGDSLILTKPIGTGIIATAVKYGKCPEAAEREAINWMLTLNRAAAGQLSGFEVHAVTDVTGFGLLGHAFEMAVSSGVCLEIESARVPLLKDVEALAKRGMLPGGIQANRDYVGDAVSWNRTRRRMQQILLDPQTSGGLLIGLPSSDAAALQERLAGAGVVGHLIGTVAARVTHYLSVE